MTMDYCCCHEEIRNSNPSTTLRACPEHVDGTDIEILKKLVLSNVERIQMSEIRNSKRAMDY